MIPAFPLSSMWSRAWAIQPAAQSDGTANPPVGVLPVDAIFSPVRKVNYSVRAHPRGSDHGL